MIDLDLPKAILFDLDDTIVAFDAVSEECWRSLCRRYAPRIQGLDAETMYRVIAEVRRWYMSDKDRHRYMRLHLDEARREVVGIAFNRMDIKAPGLANEVADAYSVERMDAMYLMPRAVETLQHFKNNNLGLALVTNGAADIQRKKIERFGISPFFDFIFIEEDLGFGKPDERVFHQALERLKVDASEAWMVGDDLERDIGGAMAAGIFGIWVDWRRTGLPATSVVVPNKIVQTISELT